MAGQPARADLRTGGIAGVAALLVLMALPASASAAPRPTANPYGDPNLVFDGRTLTGWTRLGRAAGRS
jgi:hypothetical protein